MNQSPFELFISLVQIDQSINSINKSIQKLNQEKELLEQKNLKEKSFVSQKKDQAKSAQKMVDEFELTMKILDDQEKEKKYRLDNITSHKEYSSLKSEIDRIKSEQHSLEEKLITAWNKLEIAQKESVDAEKIYEEQSNLSHQSAEDIDKKISEFRQKIEQLSPEREAVEKNVPAEWLDKYNVMKSRVADPVVPVTDDICSACFYKVSAPDFQLLERRKLVQCKDCFRLLYLPSAMQPASKTSDSQS